MLSTCFAGLCVVVKAHEEDEVEFLPIWSGRLPEMDPEKVPKGHNLGGKTLGEELGKFLNVMTHQR